MQTFKERYTFYKQHGASAKILEKLRSREIAARICAKYTRDDQIALLMDEDEKPGEWNAYQAFRACVKAEVDAEIAALKTL